MRRSVSWGLFVLGAFLLVLGLVCIVWVPNNVEKVPLSTKNTTHLSGTVVKLGDSADVKATSVTTVDSKKSAGDNLVWVNVSCVVNVASDTACGTKGTGADADPNVVSISTDAFATDRHTADSVKFPGTLPEGSVQKSGLVNKWPFDSQKKTYNYWDDLSAKAVPVKYVSETKLDGLKVYKYRYVLSDVSTEIAEGTDGKYSQDQTFYIEPKTGAIVQQVQHQVRTLEDGTSVLDLKLQFTDKQVKSSVDDAKSSLNQLKLVEVILPIVGLVLGLLLLALGVLMARRGEPADDDASGVTLKKTGDARHVATT